MAKVIRGAQLPGGIHTVSATAQPLSDDNTACTSIFIQSPSTNASAYWGYDDMPGVIRGVIEGGGALTLTHVISPSSVYIYGTAGNRLYWTTVVA